MKSICILVSLLALTNLAHAQPAKISGRVPGSINDTVQIRFWEVEVNGASLGSQTIVTITDGSGRFEYTTPSIHRPARIEVQYFGNNRKYANLRNGLFRYILLPGDNIHMEIEESGDRLSYVFSGKGGAKFRCRKEVDESLDAIDVADIERSRGDTSLWNWKRQRKLSDSIIQVQQHIIDKYKSDLSRDIIHLLRADVVGEVRRMRSLPLFSAEAFKEHPDYYRQQMESAKELKTDTTNGSILALSPEYVSYLCYRARLELLIESKYDPRLIQLFPINYGLQRWYNKLKKEYRGPLRDMLLMRLLSDAEIGMENNEYEKCLADARKTITTPYLKEMIADFSRAKMKGSPVFDFNLPDTAGNMIALSRFKGKVICIDT